ncbi:carbohydrate ABC transporter permease [Clavibacter michiganensis subsp. phaseoli]|uniref:Carbohydrate ABC transporter permease n=1 Tax=Clavibacter phaseoli TaxID=1734031 RepID=A0A8I0SC23_9MICO|nr:carbohydrate ABC transporter permease [Clavibacter phaseoli]MBF4631738.1 carbohydrate ABC transporter permease [Clavibacter phaseoli]
MTATQPRAEEVSALPAQDRPATARIRPRRRRSAPSPRGILSGIGKYGSLIVACLFALVPIVTILMLAFKTSAEYRSTGPLDPPSDWLNFDNFVIAFSQGGMVMGFINTGIILVVSIFGTVIIGTMAAYAIDRFRFRGRRMVTALFLLATLVPAVTTQVATFQVINALELFNTRWSAILLFTGTDIVAIYIFLQFMQSIPVALDEAAMLDGASRFTVYRRIILPLLKPAIATVVIIKGIAVYNEFYIPFLYMPSRDLGVISTSLFRFMGPFGAQWEVIAAGTILVIIPTLIAFLFLQRFIYNGLTSGATK